MTRFSTSFEYALIFTLLLVVAACGGPPRDNPMLNEARIAYQNAESSAQIVSNAPAALEDAADALARSERLHQQKEDPELVTHYAYIAKQKVRIAEETAKMNAAEAEVKRAEVERQKVVLEARTAEAERAQRAAEQARLASEVSRREAEAARAEAEQERQEAVAARRAAEAALARAQELSQKIAELEAQQTERGLVLTLSDVLFDVGQAALKEGAQRATDQLATFLQEYPKRKVLIEGFTDNTGSDGFNLDLSQRRADAVRTALLEKGISSERIRTKGYGEAFPVATNATPAGRQQNRRVEVIISDENGVIPER